MLAVRGLTSCPGSCAASPGPCRMRVCLQSPRQPSTVNQRLLFLPHCTVITVSLLAPITMSTLVLSALRCFELIWKHWDQCANQYCNYYYYYCYYYLLQWFFASVFCFHVYFNSFRLPFLDLHGWLGVKNQLSISLTLFMSVVLPPFPFLNHRLDVSGFHYLASWFIQLHFVLTVLRW